MLSSCEPVQNKPQESLAAPRPKWEHPTPLSTTPGLHKPRPEPQPWRQRNTKGRGLLLQAQHICRLCWRSSHEELRYRGCSKLLDREESREAVVRRGYQHHTVDAVSASIASVLCAADLDFALAGVVALRHVNELLLLDEPPLPAGDWQHDSGTYTRIARGSVRGTCDSARGSVTCGGRRPNPIITRCPVMGPVLARASTVVGRSVDYSTCYRVPAR